MNPVFRILPVKENKKLGPYYKITLKDSQMHKYAECGNFIMVGFCGLDPYLSRPFSFLDIYKEGFSFLLKVKGRGTELLAEIKKGDKLKILGPLGKTFCPPEKGVLIAGGIGIAPVYYQSGWMKGGVLFYGAKNKKDLILTQEFKERGFTVRIITEENGGLITDLVKEHKNDLNDKQIFVCGTINMIKNIRNILNKEQVSKTYIYMEKRMGCGLGGCKSCAVKTLEGYKLVCTEGPILCLKEVKLD
jgi:dihydroorotate dehydrogenase electron transfer subunit